MGFDKNRSFEVENGLLFEGGVHVFSGTPVPVGLVDAPIGSVYVQKKATGFDLWEKKGLSINDWFVKDLIDPDSFLTDQDDSILIDQEGNILTE
jgi:hypothetical protein